tara:strand:- start:47 stop:298 length:252 start_codon:yes stop_codon:yes gene_type:complete
MKHTDGFINTLSDAYSIPLGVSILNGTSWDNLLEDKILLKDYCIYLIDLFEATIPDANDGITALRYCSKVRSLKSYLAKTEDK